MTVVPFDAAFARAMQGAAAQARRNTHFITATHRDTGEVQSWHARPRGEAIRERNAQRVALGDRWTVRAMRVRRWFR